MNKREQLINPDGSSYERSVHIIDKFYLVIILLNCAFAPAMLGLFILVFIIFYYKTNRVWLIGTTFDETTIQIDSRSRKALTRAKKEKQDEA